MNQCPFCKSEIENFEEVKLFKALINSQEDLIRLFWEVTRIIRRYLNNMGKDNDYTLSLILKEFDNHLVKYSEKIYFQILLNLKSMVEIQLK
jgi:hypothetical protein